MADPPQTVTKADTDGDPPKPKGYTAAKVFSTPELMEGILLNLFTRQLFGVLRTCKTFKDTIDGSVKLQRAMFLKLDPSVTFDPYDPELNPLLKELFFIPSSDSVKQGAGGIQFVEAQPESSFEEEEEEEDDDELEEEEEEKEEAQRRQELDLVFEANRRSEMEGKPTKLYKFHWFPKKKQKVWIAESWRSTLIVQGVPERFDATIDVDESVSGKIGEPFYCMTWYLADNEKEWGDVTLGQVVDSLAKKLDHEFREQSLMEDDYPGFSHWW